MIVDLALNDLIQKLHWDPDTNTLSISESNSIKLDFSKPSINVDTLVSGDANVNNGSLFLKSYFQSDEIIVNDRYVIIDRDYESSLICLNLYLQSDSGMRIIPQVQIWKNDNPLSPIISHSYQRQLNGANSSSLNCTFIDFSPKKNDKYWIKTFQGSDVSGECFVSQGNFQLQMK